MTTIARALAAQPHNEGGPRGACPHERSTESVADRRPRGGTPLATRCAMPWNRRSLGRLHLAFVLTLTLAFTPRLARGEGTQSQVLAETLFDQSIALMKAGAWAEACPKLAESQRLDPAPGTLMYLGDCLEKTDKLATAWATFREAEALARTNHQPSRAELARTRAAAIEKKLPYLRVDVPAETNVAALRLDGTEVGRALWNGAMPVDPGDHVLVASAPGHLTREMRFRVELGGRHAVSVEPLEREPAPKSAAAADSPPPPPPPSEPPPSRAEPEQTGGGWRRPTSYALGAGALVGLALGAGFGLSAFSDWGAAEPLCPADRCTGNGAALARDADSAATLSTVAFSAGAVLLVASAVLFFTAPKGPSTRKGAAR